MKYFEHTRLCPNCGGLVHWKSYFRLYFCDYCYMDFTKEKLDELLYIKFNKIKHEK